MAKYGEYYVETVKEKKEGSFSLLLCWVLLGRPYACTKVAMGCEPTPGHTSHYVVVTKKNSDPSFFRSKSEFKDFKNFANYFPVAGDEPAHGDEIVVFRSEQVLPRYILHYTLGKKQEASTKTPKAAGGSSKVVGSGKLKRPS